MEFKKIEDGFRLVLEGLGVAPDDPRLRESAALTAQAWYEELCAGLREDPPAMQLIPVEEGQSRGLVALQDIPVKSICAHHLLPFVGTATVAYVPEASLCGISNLSRVVDHCARKLQLQETLTDEIAKTIESLVQPRGVGVLIQATHACMTLRGVNHGGTVTTKALSGTILDDSNLRREFMTLAQGGAAL